MYHLPYPKEANDPQIVCSRSVPGQDESESERRGGVLGGRRSQLAFGGGPLHGDRILRVAYVDETGHSDKEPFCAVAGIIVNPDKQWNIIADAIQDLKERVPDGFKEDFVFHAAELWHGGRYRSTWPKEMRHNLLGDLLALPRKLKIPLIVGFCINHPSSHQTKNPSVVRHVVAHSLCIIALDEYMKTKCDPDEIAMLVAEERTEAREKIRKLHSLFSSRKKRADFSSFFDGLENIAGATLPITKIRNPPAFASKEEEVLLQLSDACAWAFQKLRKTEEEEAFVNRFMLGDNTKSTLRSLVLGDLGRAQLDWS